MRVSIDEIKEPGLRRSWDLPREEIDRIVADDPAGWRAHGPAHVDAKLDKIERRVRLEAHARAQLDVPCGRCLVPVTVELPVDFELTLVPSDEYEDEGEEGDPRRERGSAPRGGSFDPQEAEEEVYAGKVIDLDPLLREQLLLALPGYPVCREACKGLCPVCGANLNERECGCDRKVPDPRWAGLKDIKLQ
jgi:uncharacterized protein